MYAPIFLEKINNYPIKQVIEMIKKENEIKELLYLALTPYIRKSSNLIEFTPNKKIYYKKINIKFTKDKYQVKHIDIKRDIKNI